MNIADKLKQLVKDWLNITPSPDKIFSIQEGLSFRDTAIKHNIIYNGDPYELEQLYKQVLYTDRTSFWGNAGADIRKISTNLPKVIVDTLANIVMNDFNGIKFDDLGKQEIWDAIYEDNELVELIKEAVKKTLIIGDGAFKISFFKEISELPIIEYVSGENIEIVNKKGRLVEVQFKENIDYNNKKYSLIEKYGKGYIKYELYDKSGALIPLNVVPDLANLQDIAFINNGVIDTDICFAIPFKIYSNDRYKNRGTSILNGKSQNFDSLDESYSQLIDALRACRVRTYIPEQLIPSDTEGNLLMRENIIDNRFLKLRNNGVVDNSLKIEVIQPTLQTEAYVNTYNTALDLCLQGIISPSTLGIDLKKSDNASAQREKEKQTLFTRDNIITALQNVLIRLAGMTLKLNQLQLGQAIDDTKDDVITVEFGQYACPDFSSVVETVSKAMSAKIMSLEQAINELYPEWTDDKKEEEIQRIQLLTGAVSGNEANANENVNKMQEYLNNNPSDIKTEDKQDKEADNTADENNKPEDKTNNNNPEDKNNKTPITDDKKNKFPKKDDKQKK